MASAVEIADGVWLHKGALSPSEQVFVFERIADVYGSRGSPHGAIAELARKAQPGRIALAFQAGEAAIPAELQALGFRIFQKLRGCAAEFHAQRLNAVLYPLGSDLRMHQDNLDGEVLLFSVGCTVSFQFHVKNDLPVQIAMESGDVVSFNGGTAYQVRHGISEVLAESCVHPELPDVLHRARLGLQLRNS